MSSNHFFWKVWLKSNQLTKDIDNNYVAEVSTEGNSKRNEDIAREIINEGSEIKYDTLLSILNQSDRIKRRMIQQGNSIIDGCCRMKPRVRGSWRRTSAKFDPQAHKITLEMIPSTEMREALTEIGVEVLGTKTNGAYIRLVTDTFTGLTNGLITPNEDIRIEGDKLRIAPDNDSTVGIFFVSETGEAIPVTRRLTRNEPKTIIARVPALPAGKYTLRIATFFSNNSTLLNAARIIEYETKLIIA